MLRFNSDLRASSLSQIPLATEAARHIVLGLLFLIVVLVVAPLTHAQAPAVELSISEAGEMLQLQLRGETNRAYALQISSNLTTWRTMAELRPTNGTATFNLDPRLQRRAFLRARTVVPTISLQPQVHPDFQTSSFISKDGGDLTLITPDLRTITLSIPPLALAEPTEVQMTLVTNLAGLPFAAGSIGAVQIHPEGLFLLGAAMLSIEVPPLMDARSLASFTANNDGSGFGLVLDRPSSNHIAMPVTDFALYGAAQVTLPELEALAGGRSLTTSRRALTASGDDEIEAEACRINHPDQFEINMGQFPKSTTECFQPMVDRAIAVRQMLRFYFFCQVMSDTAVVLGIARTQQMLGLPSHSETILAAFVDRICDVYRERVEPLWEEAEENCALGIVLLQTLGGLEQSLEKLGYTNTPTCDFTLSANSARLCNVARECLRETRSCCATGKRGQEKYLEVKKIVDQFESIGDQSCFPAGMDDPEVAETLDQCLTNSWYGTFEVRHYGNYTKVTQEGTHQSTDIRVVDLKFNGGVFESDESPAFPGIGKQLSLRILGSGTAKLEDTLTSINRVPCRLGGFSETRSYHRTLTTGSFANTNEANVIIGEYALGIVIKEDGYEIMGGSPLIRTKVRDESASSFTPCEGRSRNDYTPPRETTSGALFPLLVPAQKRPFNGDTNTIQGTFQTIDNSGDHPLTSEFTWNFRRVQQR